jgi:isopenicillin-N N-acyltransferase like protein
MLQYLPYRRIAVLGILGVAVWLAAPLAVRANDRAEVVEVARGFDNAAFQYRMELDSDHDTFRVYRLNYPSSVQSTFVPNNTIPAELYLPKAIKPGSKPRPAVICLHILGGGFELTRLECTALAARGIPAMWFELPYYDKRGPPGGPRGAPKTLAANPQIFTSALAQGVEDVRRTVDVLASRPEVDPQHIGIMGVSLGGVLAGTAAGQEPRISRAVLMLAGGDVLPIIHHAQETRTLSEAILHLAATDRAAVEQAIRQVDPLQHAADLRERAQQGRVLMINAGEDEVIPRANTEKLAAALGIQDRVVWLDGLGHYTALAALPRALKTAVDFFAQELPADAETPRADAAVKSPRQKLVQILQEGWSFVNREPAAGRCHLADLEIQITDKTGKPIQGRLRLVRGTTPKFRIQAQVSGLADLSLGWNDVPWMASEKRLFLGDLLPRPTSSEPLAQANPHYVKRLDLIGSLIATLALAPEILDQWATLEVLPATAASPAKDGIQTIRLARRDDSRDWVQLAIHDNIVQRLELDIQGVRGVVIFHAWQIDGVAEEALFDPPHGLPVKQVSGEDLTRMWAAAFNFAAETVLPVASRPNKNSIEVVSRDPEGHGLLCQSQGKRVLLVDGTPEQMGAAQGRLLREPINHLTERVVYGVGAADSMASGIWWFDRTAEIERRTGKFLPARFMAECDAMASAAGVSIRDARSAQLFPERFHCSGVALRGKATADGRILHARVLDYMRDIGLQDYACVEVFMPAKKNAWISAGYAGFLGTVTAMNERGLAVGEMGGRGEGEWDGVPMSFLLRDIMERAGTVEEGLEILRKTPRTCEYYYVLSDKSRAMAAVSCRPGEMTVLRPGEQHPRLPLVPEDTVLVSGDRRAKALSDRIQKDYGKIDAAKLMELIKRPVAMNSNLHDAIFAPETLEFWIADAGRKTPACDEPYAHFNLQQLLEFYRQKAQTR